MDRRRLVLLLLLGASCVKAGAFECTADAECGEGGLCEASGFCSFEDPGCGSGRRYGDYASVDLAGQCIGGTGPRVDGSIGSSPDSLSDAWGCAWSFQPSNLELCALPVPRGPLDLEPGTWRIDTTTGGVTHPSGEIVDIDAIAVTMDETPSLWVVVAQQIRILPGATLVATGSRALVLVSGGDLEVSGTIDVSAYASGAPMGASAPGADGAVACQGSTGGGGGPAISGGGGGGGGFGAGGGMGGAGAVGFGASGAGGAGGGASNIATLSPLRGGCPGGAGANDAEGADGAAPGRGGGALQLVARDRIVIAGSIDAGGSGGNGGGSAGAGGGGGGGGGGSGGGLLLESAAIAIQGGALCANGGSGGQGGQYQAAAGAPGREGTCSEMDPAVTPSANSGGAGGAGGVRSAGAGSGGAVVYGGGGGGGAVGRIVLRATGGAPEVDQGSVVSPAPAPAP